MSVTSKPLVTATTANTVDTTHYTAPAATRTIVDKFSAYNADTVPRTLSINLLPSGVVVATSNRIVSKTLAAGETYLFPEIVGHTLEAGGSISAIASAAGVIVIRATGREVT